MHRSAPLFFLYAFFTPLIGFIAAFFYSLYTGTMFNAFSVLGIAYAVGLIPSILIGLLIAQSFSKTGQISRLLLIIIFAATVIIGGWLFYIWEKPTLIVLLPIGALWGLIIASTAATRLMYNERIVTTVSPQNRGKAAATVFAIVVIVGVVITSLLGFLSFFYQSILLDQPLNEHVSLFISVHLPFIIAIFIISGAILAGYIFAQETFETRFFDSTALLIAGFYAFYYLLQAKAIENVNFMDLMLMPAFAMLSLQFSYWLIAKIIKPAMPAEG